MAGVTLRSTGTLESILKEFSTPGHDVNGFVESDEETGSGSDLDSWHDTTASDDTVTSEAVPASKAGAGRAASTSPQKKGVGSLALAQALPPRSKKVNKISGFGAFKSGQQDGDDSLAVVQGSCSRRWNVDTMHMASTSDVNDVAPSKSDMSDVDVGQVGIGSNFHAQSLISDQSYTAYKNPDDMGIDRRTACSNVFLCTVPTRSVQTIQPQAMQLHAAQQRTTVLLRNIPKTYVTSNVVQLLESVGYKGLFDFVDVPSNRCSRTTGGFAIVNLIHPAYAPFFWKTFDGFNQWTCKSKNICRVVWYEQLQGLCQIVHRYKNLIDAPKNIPKKARPWLLNERMLFPNRTVTG